MVNGVFPIVKRFFYYEDGFIRIGRIRTPWKAMELSFDPNLPTNRRHYFALYKLKRVEPFLDEDDDMTDSVPSSSSSGGGVGDQENYHMGDSGSATYDMDESAHFSSDDSDETDPNIGGHMNQMALTSTATKKGGLSSGDVVAVYKYKNTLVDVELDTDSNQVATTYSVTDIVPSTKTIASIKFPDLKSGKGCIELLKRTGITIKGKRAVVVGRSKIVGLPVSLLLLKEDATVTLVHSRTPDPQSIICEADIVIAAVGQAMMIKGSWIKPGAAVIDIGTNAVDDASRKSGYRLVGDVDFEEGCKVAGCITPVPGGCWAHDCSNAA